MINLWISAHPPLQIFVMGVMSINGPFTNHTEQQNIRSANKNHHANMVAVPSNLFFNSPMYIIGELKNKLIETETTLARCFAVLYD